MWNLDILFFFQHPRPTAQTGAVADAELPSLFLGQCLRAQTTCTAPAGKLSEVISLKISTCCQLTLLIYIRP